MVATMAMVVVAPVPKGTEAKADAHLRLTAIAKVPIVISSEVVIERSPRPSPNFHFRHFLSRIPRRHNGLKVRTFRPVQSLTHCAGEFTVR